MKTIAGLDECASTHVALWTRHRRDLLASQVRATATVSLALLTEARITPWRASALAMRMTCDPD